MAHRPETPDTSGWVSPALAGHFEKYSKLVPALALIKASHTIPIGSPLESDPEVTQTQSRERYCFVCSF
jgi:hypothetical protein